jgi:hypothetical protein
MAVTDTQSRFGLMQLLLLAAVVAVSLFNGQWFPGGRWSGPAFDFLSYWLTPYMRGTTLGAGMTPVYIISALLSLLTFAVSRIPATLYERMLGLRSATSVSMLIWLGTAALLSYPAYKAWQDAF